MNTTVEILLTFLIVATCLTIIYKKIIENLED